MKGGRFGELNYIGSHTPILYGIEYTVQRTPDATIIDGTRIWNKETHAQFFDNLPFKEEWDPEFYVKNNPKSKVLSPECVRWLRFDLDFHIQSLIPHVAAEKFAHSVKKGALRDLVYRVGGVDPCVLRRAGASYDLVRDAYNLNVLSDLCKKFQTVWLTTDMCKSIAVEESEPLASSLERLAAGKAIVYRDVGDEGDVNIALGWMARLEEKMPPSITCVFAANTCSPYIKEKKLTCSSYKGNPRLRADHLVDQKKLPVFFMKSRLVWGEDLSPSVDLEPKVRRFGTFTECQTYIQDVLAKMEWVKTTMTFSRYGKEGFEKKYVRTCIVEKSVEAIKICLSNPNAVLVDRGSAEKSSEISLNLIPEKIEYVGRAKWTDLHKYIRLKPHLVIAYFSSREDLAWLEWLECFDASVKREYVGVF